jgi:ABC-type transport system involved in multi-copper enzyme maturation permease subunit
MIKRLIYKDWYFNRWAILAYVAVGLLSVLALGAGHEMAFYAGSTLLITVLVTIGAHLAMVTVIYERRDQTLAFVMTLPISPMEYTTAKVLANFAIFGLSWITLLIGTIAVIAGTATVPDGLIPFSVVLLVQLFTGYCLMLAVALVTESQGWTIGALVLGNLLFQCVLYGLANLTDVGKDLTGNSIVWRQPVVAALGIEIAAILMILALTFYLQARKTDYL